jgi:hypothetical protein
LNNNLTQEPKLKRKTLNKIVQDLLFEDVAYGIYDRPGLDKEADPEFEPTLQPDVPLKPTEMMSSQLADERPPVEDEEYIPTSLSDLSKAASAIAQLVPNDQIEHFYRKLHSILDDATARGNDPDIDEEDVEAEKNDEQPIEPENVKKEGRLREAGWDSDDPNDGNEEYDEMGRSVLEDEDFSQWEEAAEEATGPTPAEDGEATFDQIAQEYGFAGAPGARQHIDMILKRMNYFGTKVTGAELPDLIDYAVGEYIDVLADPEIEMFEPEDVEVLKKQTQSVKELDSFKYFFVAAFVMPGVQIVQRQGRKRLEAYLESQSVPKQLWQTITNQATGGAERNPAKLAAKIGKVAAKLELSDQEAIKLADSLEAAFASMKKMADPQGGIGTIATDKWRGTARSKQIKLALNSLSQTQEDFDDLGIDVQDDQNAYIKKSTRPGYGPGERPGTGPGEK